MLYTHVTLPEKVMSYISAIISLMNALSLIYVQFCRASCYVMLHAINCPA